ncbi:MAG: efflux RND transporter periplasmic adaptor subunit [Gammaproteobacteria bacterium]|jgi:RND family efflux transporter MFP subunit|nr:efflux RND transporter periplasmic adaptor subunit [Gammaproteobacteria bacterium]
MIISKKRRPVSLLLIPALFALLLLSACDDTGTPPVKQKRSPGHLVETISAEIKPVSHQQVLSGTLEAATTLRLHNEEAGLITRIPFHEGDAVKQGALLVALDSDMIKAELDKTTAQRQQAGIDYNRLKKLLPKNLTSEEEVARSLTTLNIAIAEERMQQLRMDRTRITAPFDGVVSQRNNEPGDAVDAHSHIMSLIKPDSLLVKVRVSDQWLTLVKTGDAMQLTIDALGDVKHSAYIERIHPEIDAATRKGTIELLLRPLPKHARSGQLARVHFQSQANELLVLPAHTIHHDINGAYAYLAVNNEEDKTIARQRYLTKGRRFGEWIEIIDGLDAGDQVITKGFLSLRDGKAINIVWQEADSSRPDIINSDNTAPANAAP